MQPRRWPTGAHRVDAVVLTIALMCTKNFDYEALTLRELRDKRGVDLDRVSKMDVIRGRITVDDRDGEPASTSPSGPSSVRRSRAATSAPTSSAARPTYRSAASDP